MFNTMGIRCSRREKMERTMVNWTIVGVLIATGLIWWSIFANGFFITLIWILVIGATMGIVLKVLENRY